MVILSIIIPVYNEERTLKDIVERVQQVNLNKIKKEIVIIDDCSSDDSLNVAHKLSKKYRNIKVYKNRKNCGKGYSVRNGFNKASGDFVIIQDADLEYDPNDYRKLINELINNNLDVVYGSRFLNKVDHKYYIFYLGNRLISFLFSLFLGHKFTDVETCYKLFRRGILDSLDLQSNDFGFEVEVTIKLIKKKFKIREVPISYNPRSFKEGKK